MDITKKIRLNKSDMNSSIKNVISFNLGLTTTDRELVPDNSVVRINGAELADQDRQKSNKFFIYGNASILISDELNLLPKSGFQFFDTNSDPSWEFTLTKIESIVNHDYYFNSIKFNTADGIPFTSEIVNATNGLFRLTCGCKHNTQVGEYVQIGNVLLVVTALGIEGVIRSEEYILTVKKVGAVIPQTGTFKRVIDPTNIMETRSEYGVCRLKKISTPSKLIQSNLNKNIFNQGVSFYFDSFFTHDEPDPFGLPSNRFFINIDHMDQISFTKTYEWVGGQNYDNFDTVAFYFPETHDLNVSDTVTIVSDSSLADYSGTWVVDRLGNDNGDELDRFVAFKDPVTGLPMGRITNQDGQTLQSSGTVSLVKQINKAYGYVWDITRNTPSQIDATTPLIPNLEFNGDFIEFNPFELRSKILSSALTKIFIPGESEGLVFKNNYEVKLFDFSQEIETGDKFKEILPDYAKYYQPADTWRYRDRLPYGSISSGDEIGQTNGVDYPYNNDAHYIFNNINLFVHRENRTFAYDNVIEGKVINLINNKIKC